MNNRNLPVPRQPAPLGDRDDLTFNFAAVLPGQAGSKHTHRAYFRWVDQYLVDLTGVKPTRGPQRIQRMCALPIPVLQNCLSATQLRAWPRGVQ